MKTKHWILIGLLVTLFFGAVLYFLLRGGIAPKAVRVLNPTYFEKPEEIGAVIARRFWQELRETKTLVLASHPLIHNYDRIWIGLLAVAKSQGIQVGEVRVLDTLRPIADHENKLPRENIFAGLSGDGLTVVHIISQDNEWQDLKSSLPENALAIFSGLLAVQSEELVRIVPPCNEAQPFSLSCLMVNASRPYFRKKRDLEKLSATMERHALRSFVLFVHEP